MLVVVGTAAVVVFVIHAVYWHCFVGQIKCSLPENTEI